MASSKSGRPRSPQLAVMGSLPVSTTNAAGLLPPMCVDDYRELTLATHPAQCSGSDVQKSAACGKQKQEGCMTVYFL